MIITVETISSNKTNLLKEYSISIENRILIITKIINKEKKINKDFLLNIQLKSISSILKKKINDIIKKDSGI